MKTHDTNYTNLDELKRIIMIGTPLGAIFGSSAFMNVATTSALAITAGSALADAGFTGDAHASASATLAVLTGLLMAVAGAATPEAQLPKVKQAVQFVVILRLRGQEGVGSSFIAVVERYSQQLKARGGKLMLAGVHPRSRGNWTAPRPPVKSLAQRIYSRRRRLSASARVRSVRPRSAGFRQQQFNQKKTEQNHE